MAYTVLLVDDEPGIRNVLGIYLEDAGFDVTTAADGRTAQEQFKILLPDIVLTDIRMPGLNGIDLLKSIKKRTPDTEVIMITGHGDMDLAIESLKLDAADFISKPVSNDRLDIALKRACEKIDMRRQLAAYTENLQVLVAEKTRELSTSQKKYVQLFNESPCYITIQDKNLKIVETNRLFKQHFTHTGFGTHCYSAYMHRNSPCSSCPVLKTFEDGQTHNTEKVVRTKTGELINVLVRTSPILDESGRINLVMEMSTDITEVRKLQDHLAFLGLQIGSISHGIKGLLTGLDGGAYLIGSGLQKSDNELIGEGWEIVKDKIDTIREMVLNILYQAKEREVIKSPVSATDFMNGLADTLQPLMTENGIDFKVTPPETDFSLNIDKTMLTVAFTNILENAVDALKAVSRKKKKVTFSVEQTGTTVIFKIQDNGKGIPKEKQDLIFNLFYSEKGNKVTGIGIFIADRSVKQHDGSIDIDSEPGRHTRFIITLPMGDVPESPPVPVS